MLADRRGASALGFALERFDRLVVLAFMFRMPCGSG